MLHTHTLSAGAHNPTSTAFFIMGVFIFVMCVTSKGIQGHQQQRQWQMHRQNRKQPHIHITTRVSCSISSSLFPSTSVRVFSNAANARLSTKARSKGSAGGGHVGRSPAWVGSSSWTGTGMERVTDAAPGADTGVGVGADKAEAGAETDVAMEESDNEMDGDAECIIVIVIECTGKCSRIFPLECKCPCPSPSPSPCSHTDPAPLGLHLRMSCNRRIRLCPLHRHCH